MGTISRSVLRYAPSTARFLLTVLSEHTPLARRFAVQAPLAAVDGGEGGDFTVSVGDATPSAKGVVQLAGQLGGAADAPDVRGLRITGGDGGEGPQLLTLGNVKTGEALVRSGSTVVSVPMLSTVGGTMTGDLAMGGHKVTGLSSGTATDDAATYGQLMSMLNGLDWQASVLRADLNAVPTSPAPSPGDRFLVATGASGSPWGGHVGHIAVFNGGSSWTFITPTKGTTVHIDGGTCGGTDLSFDGTIWVNIGASVDHNATLNRSADDAHSQYQLGNEKDATNGYAGLAGGIVTKPVKAIRTATDPGGAVPGEVWINGTDLKYQNNNGGGGQIESVERVAMKDQTGGYAGLNGSGRVADAHAPAKSAYTSGSQAIAPGDIGAEPAITTLPVSKGGTGATSGAGALTNLGAVAKAGDTLSGDLAMAGHRVTGLATGAASADAATYGQLIAMINGLDWQASVKRKDITDPSGLTPAIHDRYLILATGAGVWTGHTGQIAEWDGAAWAFTAPNPGFTVNVEFDGVDLHYNGSAWVNIGASVDHSSLLNLGANDHPQYQLGSAKDANNGYAGLDGGGRVPAGHAPAKAVYATGGGQALVPADIGAPPTGRAIATGAGLAGGGDLTADRTLKIAAFTGLVTKDADPTTTSYASGITNIPGATVDVGADGTLLPMHIRLPPAVDNTKLNTEVVLVFSDTSSVLLVNTNNGSPADFDMLGLADIMMGGLGAGATNNGKHLQKIVTQVHNITGSSFSADIGPFRVRAYAVPCGAGSAL